RSLINMPVAVIRYQYDNHLGSASLELDATAQIISYEEYHPFGSTSYRSGRSETEVSLKRYKYVGKERDEETGLYYYGFRYYAPWIARFINVDPLQHEYPHYTPFQYAGNKPITYVDLDGLEEGVNNHREGDQRVDKFNSINTILPTFQYKTYYWHTGTQKKVDVVNEDGTKERATIGYAPGWYPEDIYFNITKDVVTNKNLVFSEGTKFAAHWNTIATAAYLKKYENSDFWINPSTEKWELNPYSFKGINQNNIIFDVAGFAYGFSLMKIGAKSIANQIPSASKKIVSEVVEEGMEKVATKGGTKVTEAVLSTAPRTIESISPHAVNQAITRGFKTTDILNIVREGTPQLANGRYGAQWRYMLNGNTVIINATKNRVITIFSNTPGTAKGLGAGFIKIKSF
ncbi:MAG: RHS repeat-associated core domain-containing protein, partial [Bacteroidales bacterium]|nr:RHS repeat-associated core domain-containing protein [Bacteroidales bacterium]